MVGEKWEDVEYDKRWSQYGVKRSGDPIWPAHKELLMELNLKTYNVRNAEEGWT